MNWLETSHYCAILLVTQLSTSALGNGYLHATRKTFLKVGQGFRTQAK